jgi:hypothetical protein
MLLNSEGGQGPVAASSISSSNRFTAPLNWTAFYSACYGPYLFPPQDLEMAPEMIEEIRKPISFHNFLFPAPLSFSIIGSYYIFHVCLTGISFSPRLWLLNHHESKACRSVKESDSLVIFHLISSSYFLLSLLNDILSALVSKFSFRYLITYPTLSNIKLSSAVCVHPVDYIYVIFLYTQKSLFYIHSPRVLYLIKRKYFLLGKISVPNSNLCQIWIFYNSLQLRWFAKICLQCATKQSYVSTAHSYIYLYKDVSMILTYPVYFRLLDNR